jgi:aminopeptidase N
MKRLRFWLIFSLYFTSLRAAEWVLDNSTRDYDQQHIQLDLRFNFEDHAVFGDATLTVLPLKNNFRELNLHAQITTIKSVRCQGKNLKFSQADGVLKIQLHRAFQPNEPVVVAIKYATNPGTGLHFFYPSKEAPEMPYQIWSQGQGENNRYWIPCFDLPGDKLKMDLLATVPANLEVISNGHRVNVAENPRAAEKTFHWKMDSPQMPYLIALAIGEFFSVSDTVRGVPLHYVIPVRHRDADIDLIFGRTPDMITFFSDYIGPYPYEQYTQIPVHDFKHGGMENATATILNSRIFHTRNAAPNYSPETLIAHELAHQWFGDLLSVKSWPHFWLHEAFATYFTDLYFEFQHGKDELRRRRLEQNRWYFDYRKDVPLRDVQPADAAFVPADFSGMLAYYRGAAILHSLRFELGDEIFRRGIQEYVRRFQFGDVVSEDFRQIMEEISGRDLAFFFNQWIYGAGHPVFEVGWNWNDSTKQVTLNVAQTQEKSPAMDVFQVTVPLEISAGKQRISTRLSLNQRQQTFYFRTEHKPEMVCFNKYLWTLMELHFNKSFEELRYQLQYDDDGVGRILAAEQIREYGAAAIWVLARALHREPYFDVRAAVVKSLGQLGAGALAAVQFAATDADARVRETAMDALAHFPAADVAGLLEQIFREDSNDYVRAAAILSLGKVAAPTASPILLEALQIDSHKNVIRANALNGLKELRDPSALPRLPQFAKYQGNDDSQHLLEAAALGYAEALAKTNRAAAISGMIAGLTSPFARTRYLAAALLKELPAKDAVSELQAIQKTLQRRDVIATFEEVIQALNK